MPDGFEGSPEQPPQPQPLPQPEPPPAPEGAGGNGNQAGAPVTDSGSVDAPVAGEQNTPQPERDQELPAVQLPDWQNRTDLILPPEGQTRFAEALAPDQQEYFLPPDNLDAPDIQLFHVKRARRDTTGTNAQTPDSLPKDRWHFMGGSEMVAAYAATRLEQPGLSYADFLESDEAKQLAASQRAAEQSSVNAITRETEIRVNELRIVIAERSRYLQELAQRLVLLDTRIESLQRELVKLADEGEDEEAVQTELKGITEAYDQRRAEHEALLEAQRADQDKLVEENAKLQSRQENPKETEATDALRELQEIGGKITALQQQIEEAQANNQDTAQLEAQLNELIDQRFDQLAVAAGITGEQLDAIKAERQSNPDAAVLRLLFSLAGERNFKRGEVLSKTMDRLERFVTNELAQFITEKYNSHLAEGQEPVTLEQAMRLPVEEALRRVIMKQGKTAEQAQAEIDGFLESLNARDLGVKKDDLLRTVLEAAVRGKRPESVFRRIRRVVKELQSDLAGLDTEEKKKERIERFRKQVGSMFEFGAKSQLFIAYLVGIASKNLDLGAFISMLLVGEGHSSMLENLGYKSETTLERQGYKNIVGLSDVSSYVEKNVEATPDQTAKTLLLSGLEDLIPSPMMAEYRSLKPQELFNNEQFTSLLEEVVKKQDLEFRLRILRHLKKIDDIDKERKLSLSEDKTKMTILSLEAMAYILGLPQAHSSSNRESSSMKNAGPTSQNSEQKTTKSDSAKPAESGEPSTLEHEPIAQ